MLREHPQGVVGLLVRSVGLTRQLGRARDQVVEGVALVGREPVLHDRRGALQPHAGVDVGRGELGARAVAVVVELREDQVPDLDESLAAVGGRQVGAVLLAVVVVDLAARAAGALLAGGAPEVVLVAVADDALGGDADVAPVALRLVVIEVDAHPQPLLGQFEHLGDELPRPRDCLLLEVVADAEVPQHLEEGEVLGVAHVLDVGGAEALLRRRQPWVWRIRLARKVRLELHHACARQQQRRVAHGNQRRRRRDEVPPLGEEIEVGLADFVGRRWRRHRGSQGMRRNDLILTALTGPKRSPSGVPRLRDGLPAPWRQDTSPSKRV